MRTRTAAAALLVLAVSATTLRAGEPSLSRQLRAKDPRARVAALVACGASLNSESAAAPDAKLAELVSRRASSDPDDHVRAAAVALLAHDAFAGLLSAKDLLPRLHGEERSLVGRQLVLAYAARLQEVERDQAWRMVMDGQDPRSTRLRSRLVEALGIGASPADVVALGEIASNDSQPIPVRWGAVRGLDHARLPETIPHLAGVLRTGSPGMKAAAYESLVSYTGRDLGTRAIPWLELWEREGREMVKAREEKPHGHTEVAEDSRHHFEFFGVKLPANPSVFAIDCSASMRILWPRVREEFQRAVSSLPPSGSFDVVFFNHDVSIWRRYLVPAGPTAEANLLRHLDEEVEPKGHTNIYDTLELILNGMKGDGPYSEVTQILLASDGEPNRGRLKDPEAILRSVDHLRPPGVKIHTFALQERGQELLRSLAEASGGTFTLVKKD